MLLDTYKERGLMWLTTLMGATSEKGLYAFRGDLVAKEGEYNEAAKKSNPPIALVKQACILADDDKIRFIGGNFADVDELPHFVERFGGDLADNCLAIFYIDNLADNCQVELEGQNYVLITTTQGMIWNELLDECYLEKSDLKGQSAEDKMLTVVDAFKDYKPKYPASTYDDALASRTDVVREAWGAV